VDGNVPVDSTEGVRCDSNYNYCFWRFHPAMRLFFHGLSGRNSQLGKVSTIR
jgi:hypothetical protein